MGLTHIDRRLHQMLFAEMDYEVKGLTAEANCAAFLELKISVDRCLEKDYSVVTVRCRDRPKLMFDIVCTLTDMNYVVFHATISSDSPYATQVGHWLTEYYIRHMDGSPVNTEGEEERVIKCIKAAILRRVSEGLSLELCAKDRVGLLSEVTRVLRENGLSVSRAGVTTVGEQAVNIFYVRDPSGNPVDMKTIERLRKEIGHTMMLNVKRSPSTSNPTRPQAIGPVPLSGSSTCNGFDERVLLEPMPDSSSPRPHRGHGPAGLPAVVGIIPFPVQRLGSMRDLLHEERYGRLLI
ncbi:hypothetical protein M8C21_012204 [Ambrosia artemisiifolia]|uniref:ACT domain-containing protein ACR n=1 Tax=Ambrosia artemisiifolia TaxID=4212 RepID=A0AAD5D8A3_AMBAR|nr:hypothetical protein M8C21_012204 [Ambrosia artemisiifolia]